MNVPGGMASMPPGQTVKKTIQPKVSEGRIV